MTTFHWLALTLTPGIGGATARKLLDRFGDIESIFEAPREELAEVPRITPQIAGRLLSISLEQLQAELLSLDEEGIDVLTWDDDRFPDRLRSLSDAPLTLFVRGAILPADESAVAIAGTRQPSLESRERAELLSRELAERGITIVSGLAEGIDTVAHAGALACEGGRTLAVLGSGVRVIHPRSNRALAEQIAARGAVLSEYHPNAPPRGPQLMARDRIVSGLSQGVIVVEASLNSGSVDTAGRAKKQGRAVYAMPGSAGTDALLAEGALPINPESFDFDSFVADLKRYPLDGPPQFRQGRLF
jgi:DNA processing protein